MPEVLGINTMHYSEKGTRQSLNVRVMAVACRRFGSNLDAMLVSKSLESSIRRLKQWNTNELKR